MKPVYTYFGRGLIKKDKGTRRQADLGKQVFGTSLFHPVVAADAPLKAAELGIETVAIYGDGEEHAQHVRYATDQ